MHLMGGRRYDDFEIVIPFWANVSNGLNKTVRGELVEP
jgi:hypothetical protein